MAQVGAVYTQIGADDASFQSAIKRTRSSLDGLAKKTADTNARMAGSFGGIGRAAESARASVAGFAAGIGIATITTAIKSGLEYASSIGEVAQQLGVGTTALQEYRFVAQDVGVSQETLEKGLQKLTRSIGDAANGSKAQVSAFRELGVSVRDVNGAIRPTEDVLHDLIAAFSQIKSPAERARLEVALFGKAGQQLDTLLAGGVSQVDNLRNAAHKLGIVIDAEFIKQADDAADSLGKVTTVLQAQIAGVVAKNSQQIVGLANSLLQVASAAGQAGNAYDGFLRIVQKEGVRGFLRTITGDGRDQIQAGTLKGYAQQKIDQRDKAADAYSAAKRSGMTMPVQRRRLAAELVEADRAARAAIAEYRSSRVPAPAAAPKATEGGALPTFAGSGGGKARSARGGGGGGGESDLARAAKADAAALQSLYDRLYPEQAASRAFLDDLALLEKVAKAGGAGADDAREAMAKLFAEGRAELDTSSFVDELRIDFEDLGEAIGKIPVEVVDHWSVTMDANAKLARSFIDTSQDIRYSLQSLVDDVKRGDFLGILDSALRVFEAARGGNGYGGGLFGSLGKLFGGSKASGTTGAVSDWVGNTLKSGYRLPGLATGGVIKGMSGIDRNVLSINGVPAAMGSAGEQFRVEPNGMRDRNEMTVRVVKGDLFDVVIDGRAINVVGQAAPAMVGASAGAATSKASYRAGRRLA